MIPADRKWYANYLVSEVILKVMEEMDPHFPPVAAEEGFSAYREALLSGKFDRKAILQRSKKKEKARNAVEGIPEEDSTEKDLMGLLSEPVIRDAEAPVNAERSGNEEPSEKTEDFAKDEASLNPEIPGDAEDTGKAPETEAVIADTSNVEETAAAPDTEAAETAAAPDTEAAETAAVPDTAEETAPAAPAETETVADAGEEPPEKPAARRRRTRKPAAEKESPEVESSAPKAAGSVKKARSGKEKEASAETPKRRQARKDGPPKTVGETLARRARKRGGS